jgi:hypothetical protein
MQTLTNINNLKLLRFKYFTIPLTILLTGLKGGIRILLNSRQRVPEARPVTWTFDVDKLIAKIPEEHKTGLYQFCLSKLDPELVTEDVVNTTTKAIKKNPTELGGINLALLTNTDLDLKDIYEYLILTKMNVNGDFKRNAEEALEHLAAVWLSAVKCREPVAIAEFKRLVSLGYPSFGLVPTSKDVRSAIRSIYILANLETFKKDYWKNTMVYLWYLSKHEYNCFYTGLLLDAYPELLRHEKYKNHLLKCIEFLREEDIETMSPENTLNYLANVTMGLVCLKRIQGALDANK